VSSAAPAEQAPRPGSSKAAGWPGETYYPGVVTTAIDPYAPDFTPSRKTVVDVDGNDPARPDDTLEHTPT
jgi:hypothetical protein